jgi:hypothetical protein
MAMFCDGGGELRYLLVQGLQRPNYVFNGSEEHDHVLESDLSFRRLFP